LQRRLELKREEMLMEFSNYEQVKEYGTAFKLFSESYMTSVPLPLENVKENLEKIESIMKELPSGDSDRDIDTHYICLGIILNKLRLEYAERTLEENKKILEERKFPSEIEKNAIITIEIPEAEKQKRLSEEWLRYYGVDITG
jgi:hypothetical protein